MAANLPGTWTLAACCKLVGVLRALEVNEVDPLEPNLFSLIKLAAVSPPVASLLEELVSETSTPGRFFVDRGGLSHEDLLQHAEAVAALDAHQLNSRLAAAMAPQLFSALSVVQ